MIHRFNSFVDSINESEEVKGPFKIKLYSWRDSVTFSIFPKFLDARVNNPVIHIPGEKLKAVFESEKGKRNGLFHKEVFSFAIENDLIEKGILVQDPYTPGYSKKMPAYQYNKTFNTLEEAKEGASELEEIMLKTFSDLNIPLWPVQREIKLGDALGWVARFIDEMSDGSTLTRREIFEWAKGKRISKAYGTTWEMVEGKRSFQACLDLVKSLTTLEEEKIFPFESMHSKKVTCQLYKNSKKERFLVLLNYEGEGLIIDLK